VAVVGRQWVVPLERGDGDTSNGGKIIAIRPLLIEIQRFEKCAEKRIFFGK
jgi:hypothetical protein